MKTLGATFQIVTPLFLGGADQRAQSIRPASVKGALRFWWRALNWSRLLDQKAGDEVQALQALHAEEARIFGIAASDKEGGQGIFAMQVHATSVTTTDQPFERLENGNAYLLGMGLAKYDNSVRQVKLSRNALAGKGELGKGDFDIKCLFRPTASESDIAQVSNALLLFGLLGALGSRARHGLGSLAMVRWTGKQVLPKTADEYESLIKSLLQGVQTDREPPFTAFSSLTRIDLSLTDKAALQLLNLVGSEQQMYRSFGQKEKVGGKLAERNFKDDHDLILNATEGHRISKAPRRAVFGLPHNYYFSSTKAKADINYAPDKLDARRASPLMLHIHPLEGKFVAVHTLLPAKFLPEGAKIRIKLDGTAKSTENVNPSPDWSVLHGYLDRFINKGGKRIYG